MHLPSFPCGAIDIEECFTEGAQAYRDAQAASEAEQPAIIEELHDEQSRSARLLEVHRNVLASAAKAPEGKNEDIARLKTFIAMTHDEETRAGDDLEEY